MSKNLDKVKKSISVLHHLYLTEAAKEAGAIITRNNQNVKDIFGLLMSIYNKKIKEHQVLFLLIHLFEIAFRTKSTVIISNHFSSADSDDWFLTQTPIDKRHEKLIIKIHEIVNHKKINISDIKNSFEIFNLFSMGDLEWLIKTFWGEFQGLFMAKTYKNQTIPAITTKASFLQKFSKIRNARNDIFHSNPPKMKKSHLIEDIELLLLHLEFNLYDAVNNIDPEHKIIKLKYNYLNGTIQ